jgi:hypothetical protein
MRPAPIVPIPKEDRVKPMKHSRAELRFSKTVGNKFSASWREDEELEVFEKPKVSARRRIAPTHPWYRKPRLPDQRRS